MAKVSKKTKIIAAVLASLTGFTGASVAAGVIAYDSFFPRYERPDYAVTAGQYCYERVSDTLKREEFFYKSKDSELKGYYYESEQNKGLVVVSHGFHAGADDYIPLISYMIKSGYNVFAYDVNGTYDSKGDSLIGMCQSLVDLDYTLSYIGKTEPYSSQPLFLIGHSWGGYAVTSVLEFHKQVKACAGIAPMNNGFTIMLEKGKQYAGPLALVPVPIFNAYQRILFSKYANSSGVKGINSVDIPVIIAHGVDDEIISYTEQSVISHKKEITNPNVIYYDGFGVHGDHNNIWHSDRSALYQQEVASKLRLLRIQKGKDLTYDEKADFYKTVDHALYSEVNEELMDLIVSTFDSQL
ncbi:MAG: alpha/beta fold hydrolase [Clostridia bacterium]|nr:alpha/beta fold hydrolase [Clostridia bacterium]